MILKSFDKFVSSIILAFLITSLQAEENKIDIWKKNSGSNNISNSTNQPSKNDSISSPTGIADGLSKNQSIKIEDSKIDSSEKIEVFGVHDPADYNFNLNMWSSTNAEDVRSSLKRLKKIKLSKTSSELLENVLLSFSYPPVGMDNKEFVNLKINWLIDNDRVELIEDFLKQNNDFNGKSRAVQYLVDKNIAQANIKKGCEQIRFIDSKIKDAYLEKFKIYCLVFDKKNSQAQLLYDLLREQNQSDKFFDDKINFLLGITNKTSEKINDKNLLNFYLSSVTIKDFNYEPNKNTKKEIWNYLNAANLIRFENIEDRNKLNDLELAANLGQVDVNLIFSIYKQISFDLNTLINAKNSYQRLDEIDARSLIYQRYLLSEDIDSKVEYLFILEELFKKNKKLNIYSKFLSDEIKKIGIDNIPENYKELAESKILTNVNSVSGKIQYNDKVLHQSKIIKVYVEKENFKKNQKDIDKIFKKISKNRKYFYSAKDLALIESLVKDGFKIPSNFNYNELASKYDVPSNLTELIKNKQNAFLALKIIEIIGEDEPNELDPETIYFITNLLNKMNLIKIRNKVLISALPLRA